MSDRTGDIEKRCDLWSLSGQRLRAGVAWRIHQGHGDALAAGTGVPREALDAFVKTGRIKQQYRARLDAAK